MTTREKLESMLIERGMSVQQANEVMDLAKPKIDEVADNYEISYDRPASEYPDIIYNTLFLFIKPIALKWIEENKPLAWFKPMFI